MQTTANGSDVFISASMALDEGSLRSVRSALREVRLLPEELRGETFKLSIARSFTVETQIDYIELALALVPCIPHIGIGDFGAIETFLLDSSERSDAALVLWRLEDLYPDFVFRTHYWSPDETEAAIDRVKVRIDALVRGYAERSSATLFLSTFPRPDAIALSDASDCSGVRASISALNEHIRELATRGSRVFVYDFAMWAERLGAGAFSLKMDLYARQPISAAAVPSFARDLSRTLRASFIPPAKVLAVDLDNVLWGGVLGESQLGELQIGQDYPGVVHHRIQRALLDLKARGVLLALVSKNNEGDVRTAFDAMTDMPLKLSDFSAIRVNWEPKHANIASIAKELNLGLDAIVFLDDQPFEQEDVRFHLPAVRVLENDGSALRILQELKETWHFDNLRVSEADRLRVNDYRAQQARTALASTENSDSFLYSLELRATIKRVDASAIGRAVQMLQKTNQFNLTTRRHSEAKLREMISDPSNVLLTISLKDRFADQGIIGLAIALRDTAQDAVILDSFLLSCRAIGRGAEDALWSRLLEEIGASGSTLVAEYVATPKNSQVSELLDRFNMERVTDSEKTRTYRLSLPAQRQWPQWIGE